jgi:MFS transporter, putative metabolite transport protein
LSEVAFEDAPFQRAHWKVATGATAGYVSDGYTLGVVGIALAGAQTQLSLTPAWLGALGGASLVGLFLGALVSGSIADRYGRRAIYAYNMLGFVSLSLLQLWVQTAAQLLLIRFLLGLVLGTDYVVCKVLLAEFMPRVGRGRALSMMGVSWAMGYALAYVAGFVLQGTSPEAWRWILGSSAVPALISLPLRLAAPESPLWLTLVGREAEARRIIDRWLGEGYGLPRPPVRTVSATWGQLLTPQYRLGTFVASTVFFCLVVPYFAVSTFIPQVMAALHIAGNDVAGLIYIIGLLLGSVAGFVVVDWFPRRVFVIGSFVITAAALLVSVTVSNLPAVLVVMAFAVFSCVLSAAQAQVYVYLPELFPTAVRASGLGIAVAVSRIGAAAGTSLLPLCVTHFGIHVALDICVATLLLGAAVAWRWAPETRHSYI